MMRAPEKNGCETWQFVIDDHINQLPFNNVLGICAENLTDQSQMEFT
jgi:hypothetical protein